MGRVYAIDIGKAVSRTRAALAEHGLLLLSDKALPSVAGLTVCGPIKGSWWAHPLCHEIYEVSQHLHDDHDVVALKILNGKTTFVPRDLWQDLYSVGTARETWQTNGLSPTAKALLAKIEERGSARADEIAGRKSLKDVRADLALLEVRLLVVTGEEHTETGAHLKRYETWACWAKRVGLRPGRAGSAEAARARLDKIGAALAAQSSATVAFPWSEKVAKRSRAPALTARSRRL